jgi:hypothetical protein
MCDGMGDPEFDSRQGKKKEFFFCSPELPDRVWGFTQPPIQGYQGYYPVDESTGE